MKLEGLYTAMVTPFLHEMVDENGLIELIHEQLAAQVEGLVFLGTTGEAPTLTEKESKRIVEIAIQEVQGATPIIVGTGTNCTMTTIEKTKLAEDLGADIALVISPYYNCPTQSGLLRHFEQLLDQTNLPILLYNHPKRTGVNLELPTLLELAKHEKILGLKEANSDPKHLNALFKSFKTFEGNFSLLCGCDERIYDWMTQGMKGSVSVISNACPLPIKNMISLLLQDKHGEAKNLFDQWSALIDFCSIETNPIPIKTLLNELGLPSGEPRLPLVPLSEYHRIQLKEAIKQSPLDLICKS